MRRSSGRTASCSRPRRRSSLYGTCRSSRAASASMRRTSAACCTSRRAVCSHSLVLLLCRVLYEQTGGVLPLPGVVVSVVQAVLKTTPHRELKRKTEPAWSDRARYVPRARDATRPQSLLAADQRHHRLRESHPLPPSFVPSPHAPPLLLEVSRLRLRCLDRWRRSHMLINRSRYVSRDHR